MFYVHNYIDWDQFNELYDPKWIKKDIRNADVVAYKLGLALTKVTNQRLEIAREEKQKREEMVEKQKTETMTTKYQRIRGGISLSNKEKRDYKSNIRDEMDPDKAGNDKY